MQLVAFLFVIVGVLGGGATFMGFLNVAPLYAWGGMAVVGLVFLLLTRRPGD